MKFQVKLKKQARKNLAKIPKPYKRKILNALIFLGLEPYVGKALEGELEGSYSFRVWPYRIIYNIYQKELRIYIIDIRHRQNAYK